MENSYQFFANKSCKYYPCHRGADQGNFNCLFCYCPMNPYEDCPGNPRYIQREGKKKIKDCTNCTFPHIPENYEAVIEFLKKKNNEETE